MGSCITSILLSSQVHSFLLGGDQGKGGQRDILYQSQHINRPKYMVFFFANRDRYENTMLEIFIMYLVSLLTNNDAITCPRLLVWSYLLFLPENHLDSVHRHDDADFLLLDVLGLELILRITNTHNPR